MGVCKEKLTTVDSEDRRERLPKQSGHSTLPLTNLARGLSRSPRCSAISNVGSASPSLLGVPRDLPIDLSRTAGQHSLNNIIGEHLRRHPDSDLLAVLTGKKHFKEALG
jgi:hypothetical protein